MPLAVQRGIADGAPRGVGTLESSRGTASLGAIGRRRFLGQTAALLGGVALALEARPAGASEEASFARRARWIAGMDALADVEPTAEWRGYAAREDERWRGARPRIEAMTNWSAREIGTGQAGPTSVFYPFAGPDALHALALFPTATRFLLVGLEPVGRLPDPSRVQAGFFGRLGHAADDLHRLTFFRTQEMSTDLARDGVLSLLVATIARLGGRVASVQADDKSAHIEWDDGTSVAKRLEYQQADVATLKSVPNGVTFLKAAMYLLGDPRFAAVRQMIFDASSIVVQDDTGIPLRHFDGRWARRLYGRYEDPPKAFADKVQPDLAAAYTRARPPLLPFGIGYHVDAAHSNLALFSRTEQR